MAPATITEAKFTVRRSRIHGRGLFAAQSLEAGETVLEYVGEPIGKAESVRRQVRRKRIFIFEVDGQFDLDGSDKANPARWANHSCEPNCEAAAEHGRIFLRALRKIVQGEELTFDYGYRLAAFPGHPCRCGAKSCAGFIVTKTERWRVRRLLRRPGRSLLAERQGKVQEACR